MNKLNYLLLLFLSIFVLMSVVMKPKSFESYFKSNIEVTIPEENLSKDIYSKQNTEFDIEAFNSSLYNL